MMTAHPEAYPRDARLPRRCRRLRDQITSPARTVLLVLLGASALVFLIACSNVANLILARSVRREGELAVRAALGARAGALRRTLLAESLVLCGAGAVLGVLIARPMVAMLARYARGSRCARSTSRVDATCCGSVSAWRSRRRCCWRSCRDCPRRTPRRARASQRQVRITPGRTGGCGSSPSRRSRHHSSSLPARACCSPR